MKTEPNEPINPFTIEVPTSYEDKTAAAMLPETEKKLMPGLTKLEYFSGLAMQAIITGGTNNKPPQIAKDAVWAAKALISELNNQ